MSQDTFLASYLLPPESSNNQPNKGDDDKWSKIRQLPPIEVPSTTNTQTMSDIIKRRVYRQPATPSSASSDSDSENDQEEEEEGEKHHHEVTENTLNISQTAKKASNDDNGNVNNHKIHGHDQPHLQSQMSSSAKVTRNDTDIALVDDIKNDDHKDKNTMSPTIIASPTSAASKYSTGPPQIMHVLCKNKNNNHRKGRKPSPPRASTASKCSTGPPGLTRVLPKNKENISFMPIPVKIGDDSDEDIDKQILTAPEYIPKDASTASPTTCTLNLSRFPSNSNAKIPRRKSKPRPKAITTSKSKERSNSKSNNRGRRQPPPIRPAISPCDQKEDEVEQSKSTAIIANDAGDGIHRLHPRKKEKKKDIHQIPGTDDQSNQSHPITEDNDEKGNESQPHDHAHRDAEIDINPHALLSEEELSRIRFTNLKLVKIENLPNMKESTLKKRKWYGKFPGIVSIEIQKEKQGKKQDAKKGPVQSPKVTVLILFSTQESAKAAIEFSNSAPTSHTGGRELKASYGGKTNYCIAFIRQQKCFEQDCPYFHEWVKRLDTDINITNTAARTNHDSGKSQPKSQSQSQSPQTQHGRCSPKPNMPQSPSKLSSKSRSKRRSNKAKLQKSKLKSQLYDALKKNALSSYYFATISTDKDRAQESKSAPIDVSKSKLNPLNDSFSELQSGTEALFIKLQHLNQQMQGLKNYADTNIVPKLTQINEDILIWTDPEKQRMLQYPSYAANYQRLQTRKALIQQQYMENQTLYSQLQQDLDYTRDLYRKLQSEKPKPVLPTFYYDNNDNDVGHDQQQQPPQNSNSVNMNADDINDLTANDQDRSQSVSIEEIKEVSEPPSITSQAQEMYTESDITPSASSREYDDYKSIDTKSHDAISQLFQQQPMIQQRFNQSLHGNMMEQQRQKLQNKVIMKFYPNHQNRRSKDCDTLLKSQIKGEYEGKIAAKDQQIQRLLVQYQTLSTQHGYTTNKYNELNNHQKIVQIKMIKLQNDHEKLEGEYSELHRKYQALAEENTKLKDYTLWNAKEVTNWIINLNEDKYSRYKDTLLWQLSEEEMDGSCLVDIDCTDLHRLGITAFKDKKEIYQSIQELISNTN